MSFPTYADYVESSIQWLPNQPSKWSAKPVKAIATINDDTLSEAVDPEQEIEYVDIGSVSLTNGIEKTEVMAFGESPSRARRVPKEGDVLVSTVRTYLKAIAPVVNQPSNLVASTGFAVIRPKPELEPGFLKYALQEEHFIQEVISRSTGVSYPAINASDIGRVLICLPSRAEQLAISIFLDRETAKIDALIAEQQRLIELLQEKRQAVISHAVTKGLNPNAPMKDSGVEWLGEVPEHWTGCRFKHCLLGLTDAEHKTCPDYGEGEYLIIRTSNVRDGVLVLEGAKYTDVNGYKEWTSRCTPNAGDIVFTREAPAGEACIIPEGITACLGQRTVLMHPNPSKVTPEYLVSSIYSGAARTFIQNLSQGSTVSHLNMGDIGNMPIALPPLKEQLHINEYTRDESRKFHDLMQQAQTSITLFRERRSALISAAVTGQIDVRGLATEEEP